MSANDDLLIAFELHDPQGIRKALDAGANLIAPVNGKRPIDWLISMYTRSPDFAACLRAMLGADATVGNDLVEATLLDDDETLRRIVQQDPERAPERVVVESAYTSLRGVSAFHVCAEFNSIRCAKVLLNAGVDVNDLGTRRTFTTTLTRTTVLHREAVARAPGMYGPNREEMATMIASAKAGATA